MIKHLRITINLWIIIRHGQGGYQNSLVEKFGKTPPAVCGAGIPHPENFLSF